MFLVFGFGRSIIICGNGGYVFEFVWKTYVIVGIVFAFAWKFSSAVEYGQST